MMVIYDGMVGKGREGEVCVLGSGVGVGVRGSREMAGRRQRCENWVGWESPGTEGLGEV